MAVNFVCNNRNNINNNIYYCNKNKKDGDNSKICISSSCNAISFLINYSILIMLIVINSSNNVKGHGMMLEPAGRASRWRYNHSAPTDYNDNELYCGGFNKQWNTNKGKCGLCGDDYSLNTPRPHEIGGKYGEGVIVRTYKTGNLIPIGIMLTTNHKGYFYFHLCNLDEDKYETESCYKKYPLRLINDKYKYYIDQRNGWHNITLKLPKNLKCSHCVLRWTYNAGNNWGICPNGTGATGCGPQENFLSCADVQIISKDYNYNSQDNYNYYDNNYNTGNNNNNYNNEYQYQNNNLERDDGNVLLPNINTNNYDNYNNNNNYYLTPTTNYNQGENIQNTYYNEYNQNQNIDYDQLIDPRSNYQNNNIDNNYYHYQDKQQDQIINHQREQQTEPQQQQYYYNINENLNANNEEQFNIPNIPIPILVNNRID